MLGLGIGSGCVRPGCVNLAWVDDSVCEIAVGK